MARTSKQFRQRAMRRASGVVSAAARIEPLESRQLLTNSVWAFPGADGRMMYQPQPLGDHIEDYSNSGYKGGTVAIPTVPVKVTVPPPTPGVDMTATIQAAINSVSAMAMDSSGFRGAVLLSPGTYDVATTLSITASGVVLRGSGQSLNSGGTPTVIHATGTGQRTIINVNGSGTRTTVSGTTHTITDKYVPVGAYSFTVDSVSGLAVGDSVIVHRPSTQAWINALGMNLLDEPWTPGSKDINMDRTITHIDGNVITVDGPITQALDVQYTDASQGPDTIYKYTATGRLTNVGVENLAGYSDYNPAVTSTEGASSTYFADEDHPWIFINIDGSQNAWVRNVTSEYFAYACVTVTGNSKFVTVEDSQCLDPVSIITGGRRYSFDVDDSDYTLFRNLYTREGRHDFVEGSTVTGPNVFVDSRADAEHADAGPHHRYSTAALWDNLTVGDLDIQNRGNLGTGHGWSGANQVVWNSTSTSGFVVQNPPTAQNWLIGSVGKINQGTVYVGPHADGIYDSTGPAGPNVAQRSLYYQQLGERMGAENFVPREVRLGDSDNYVNDGASDTPAVDAAWKTSVQNATGKMAVGFDVATGNQLIPLTFNFNLDPGTQVIGANLSIGFKSTGGDTTGDKIYIENTSRVYTWSQLGATAPGSSPGAAVIDLSTLLAALQDGKLNIAVSGNTAIDWATLNLQTASTTQPTTTTLSAVADAYVQDGTSANSNFGTATTLQTKLDATNNNRQTYLKFDLSAFSGYVTSATLRLVPTSVGIAPDTFGSGTGAMFNDISLVGDNSWIESGAGGITWNNKPAGSASFDEFLSSLNAPLNIDVTALVQNALSQTDKRLSFQILSTILNSLGQISYASRENSNITLRPQLIITSYNAITPTADAYVRDGNSANTNFGTATDLETKKDTTANSGNNREAYLQFNIGSLATAPAGATVRLISTVPDGTTPGATNSAGFVSTDTWTETGITWNNKPASSTVLGTWTPMQATPSKFDVTSLVAAAVGSSDKAISLRVFSNTVSAGITQYAAREYADASVRPLLIFKNLAPRITGIQPINTGVGVATPAMWFGVSDAETVATSLTLSATSSNTALLPNANIVFGGSGADRTFTLTPAAGKTGSANVTITVTDAQGLTSSTTFAFNVSSAIQFNGDQDFSGEADLIRIVRSGTFLDIYRNNLVTPALHTDYSSTGPIVINGLAGNDRVIVDYSQGNPIPANGLSIDTGDGTDIVGILGSAGADAITLTAGNITVNGSPLSYSNAEELDLSLGGGADTLTVAGNSAVTVAIVKLALAGGGTLSMGAASTLPDFTDVNIAAGNTFNLNGQSQTIDALDGAGTIIDNSSAAATLTLGQHDGSGSFSGNISTGTGVISLTKNGEGTQTLSGASSYTGVTNVNFGALRITNAAALGLTAGATLINGGTNTGRVELVGGITMAEPFTLGNRTGSNGGNFAANLLNVSDNNTLTGAITLASGGSYWTIQSDAGKLTISGNLTNANTTNTRRLYLRGAGAGEITGQIRQTSTGLTEVFKEDPGTWQIAGLANYTGQTLIDAGTLIVTAAGASTGSAVVVNAGLYRMTGTAAAFKTAGIMLAGGAAASIDAAGNNTLTTPFLSVLPLATFDLNDNGLIVDYIGPASPLSTLVGYLTAGFNVGAWNNVGIISTTAGNDATRSHGLGYAEASALGVTSFMGQQVDTTAVVIRYTQYGDNNLDRTVDIGNDFSLFLDGYSSHATGWINGDYTYDNTIDLGNDFNLFLSSYVPSVPAGAMLESAAIAPLPVKSRDSGATAIYSTTPVVLLSAADKDRIPDRSDDFISQVLSS